MVTNEKKRQLHVRFDLKSHVLQAPAITPDLCLQGLQRVSWVLEEGLSRARLLPPPRGTPGFPMLGAGSPGVSYLILTCRWYPEQCISLTLSVVV